MIKRAFNRIFKPDFIYIGGAIFKRVEIRNVSINLDKSQVVVVDYMDVESVVQCDNVSQALDTYRETINKLC